jgi:hypothetical protein
MYMLAPRGIQTDDPNAPAIHDHTCLRPRRHCDHLIMIIIYYNLVSALVVRFRTIKHHAVFTSYA